MRENMVADENQEHELVLTFRGPKGQAFGAPISIKVKCVVAKAAPTQVEIYKLAIKLYEQL